MVSSLLSSLIAQESHRNHKRTQKEVPNKLLFYITVKIHQCELGQFLFFLVIVKTTDKVHEVL